MSVAKHAAKSYNILTTNLTSYIIILIQTKLFFPNIIKILHYFNSWKLFFLAVNIKKCSILNDKSKTFY